MSKRACIKLNFVNMTDLMSLHCKLPAGIYMLKVNFEHAIAGWVEAKSTMQINYDWPISCH